MNKIKICYAANESYAGLTAVSMVSVLCNAENDEDIEFIILHSENGLSGKTTDKINSIKDIRPCEIKFISINPQEFKNFPMVNWITTEAWYRTKIADLCENSDKILYLDCDTMVLCSLKDLFNIDLGENYLGAVCYPYNGYLNLKDKLYFNSGVLLINAKLWRQDNLQQKIKDYIKLHGNKIKCADQDTLNVITDCKKYSLPFEYNYCENYFLEVQPRINKNPKIVHFVGPNLNRFDCMHSLKYKWQKYADMTHFKNDFADKNMYNMVNMFFKLKLDEFKFSLLSKVMLGKLKQRYTVKNIIHKKLIDTLKF